MHLYDQATYCLPDGTFVRAVHQADAGAERVWELRHLDTGVLQYTIGREGCLIGYAIWEQPPGAQTLDPFPTDLTIADLLLAEPTADKLASDYRTNIAKAVLPQPALSTYEAGF